MKRVPDWDEEPTRALAFALYVFVLVALGLPLGVRCARLRLWRIGREYGIRRQYLRRVWWQRKVRS